MQNGLNKKNPELLCPAGDFERLKAAVLFGADAVYLAGSEFGMRTAAANFADSELESAVKYAHRNGVRVYVTCNTLVRNDELERLPSFLELCDSAGVDALIISDLGTLKLAQKYAKNAEMHISVQSGIVNYETARAFYELGAKRIVVSRELSLGEIAEIRAKTPKELEIEAFVHGAMCVSFSARCLLSAYMTGRDANRGDCAQPCRWSYSLVEQKRPGQFFDITEDKKGTYILNANDLCMAEHIPELIKSGITSFKIEGRAKSHYYTAVTANAYRGAIDEYLKDPSTYNTPSWVTDELNKISHRTYSTGFYFGTPQNSQTYENAGYIRDYAVAAVVEGYEDGFILARVKNKFSILQELDCLVPRCKPFCFTVNSMLDEHGDLIEVAPHPMQLVKIPYNEVVPKGSLLRMKT